MINIPISSVFELDVVVVDPKLDLKFLIELFAKSRNINIVVLKFFLDQVIIVSIFSKLDLSNVDLGNTLLGNTLIGDDAALVQAPQDPSSILVHTIDYFKSFLSDPYIVGRIAASHALSGIGSEIMFVIMSFLILWIDIYAMNGVAVSCLALCVVPYASEKEVFENLEL